MTNFNIGGGVQKDLNIIAKTLKKGKKPGNIYDTFQD